MACGTRILLLALLLSACMPVPVGFPPHVEPVYLGPAPHDKGRTCQNQVPFIFINGPMEVSVKLIGRLGEDDTATLRVEVISRRGLPVDVARRELILDGPGADGARRTPLDFIETGLIPLAPAPGRAPAIGNLIFEAALGRLSETGLEASLPAVNIGASYTGKSRLSPDQPVALSWSPGAVRLRRVAAPWGFLPFNC